MRMKGHAQHDDQRYVPQGVLEAWAARDPIDRFEQFLVAEGHATAAGLKETAASIAELLDAAADEAEGRPGPPVEEALKGVYSEPGYERPWWPAA